MSAAKIISATTNVPLDRVLLKYENISDAVGAETDLWERIALLAGWSKWSLEPKKSQPKKSTSTNKKEKKKIKFI